MKLLIKYVLKIQLTEIELNNIKIHRELLLKNSKRRMDLVIESSSIFIPIEVKIYASDQNRQLYDYFIDANKHSKSVNAIYYLTLLGDEPSFESKYKLKDEQIKLISFKREITQWLKDCIKELSISGINNIEVILRQFLQVINVLTNTVEGKSEMELEKLITSSKDNLKASVQIEKTINKVKSNILIKLFDKINDKLKENHIDRIINHEYDYDFNNYDKCNRFYDNKKSSYPGISIRYKNKGEDGLNWDIRVRVEVADSLFVGYCIPVNGLNDGKEKPKEEIKTFLPEIKGAEFENYKNGWWLYWENVIFNNSEINFKYVNDNFYELIDDAKINEVAELTFEIIKKYLDEHN